VLGDFACYDWTQRANCRRTYVRKRVFRPETYGLASCNTFSVNIIIATQPAVATSLTSFLTISSQIEQEVVDPAANLALLVAPETIVALSSATQQLAMQKRRAAFIMSWLLAARPLRECLVLFVFVSCVGNRTGIHLVHYKKA
jgi:hypothetical protein